MIAIPEQQIGIGFRFFQWDLYQLGERVRSGAPLPKKVRLNVTPGGGKQVAALILSHMLTPQVADKICWVVPRLSLQLQAEEAFIDPYFVSLLDHDRRIRQSTNDVNPSRGMAGFVTTYQAVALGWSSILAEFERHTYILFLDEHHHIEAGSSWARALQHLVDRAAMVVLASGTFARGDGKAIAFTDYVKNESGQLIPDLEDRPGEPAFIYRRRDALAEHAIIPLRFFFQDARAEWLDRDGITRVVSSLRDVDLDTGAAAVMTVLKTSAAETILAKGVGDWLDYRNTHPRSKLLVVCSSINEAKRFEKQLRGHGITRTGIATYEDSLLALDTIRRFKLPPEDANRIDALVTVQMAYEGLDCRAITHLVCLTHIRSRPWIEQMLARATRFDPKAGRYEDQWAYVYGPDDAMLVAICEAIRLEQESALREQLERPSPPPPPPPSPGIIALGSELTHERVEDLTTGESTNHVEDELLLGLLRGSGMAWDFFSIRDLLRRYEQEKAREQPAATVAEVPPSEREKRLRAGLESYARSWDFHHGRMFGTVNRACWDAFGIRREDMELPDLERAWEWMLDRFPKDWDGQ